MRALQFDEFGGFEKLRLIDVPEPSPAAGEVVVQVRAAALNPSDIKNVQGRMVGTRLPCTPGRDFAGVVVAGPREWMGREVWGTGGDIGYTRPGSHAEKIVVPAAGVVPKPERLSFEQAASVGVNFLAAWLGLVEAGQLQSGDTVLILGVAGGVGSAAAQIAHRAGARTLGADRAAMTAERRSAIGLDAFVTLGSGDPAAALLEEARRFGGGEGVGLCFDAVGGPLFEPGLRALGPRGRQVCIASVGERRVSFDLVDFYHRQLTLRGVDTRAYDTVASAQVLARLAPGFASGDYHPQPVARRFRLDEAGEAYAAVDRGIPGGKAVFSFP